MKIIHIEGGLGNQMASYAVYIAVAESNPDDEFYIDTYLYDIKEAHSTISMWNGYELKSIFGVHIPDIRTLFTPEQVQEQINYLRVSEFWKHDWNYAEIFIKMMKKYGFYIKNVYENTYNTQSGIKGTLKYTLRKIMASTASNRLMYVGKHMVYGIYNRISSDCGKYLYRHQSGDYFYDITLDFMKSHFLNDTIGNQVRDGLSFSEPDDKDNIFFLDLIRNCNSVSLHVRRTDYLKFNEDCYKFGYFIKATRHIKKQIHKPVFFIFSDDLEWCRNNLKTIGLTEDDSVYFVGINRDGNSYRDMQLIANCKHNIFTKSSFGWWGSFLNSNPNKVTCCQIGSYVSTIRF